MGWSGCTDQWHGSMCRCGVRIQAPHMARRPRPSVRVPIHNNSPVDAGPHRQVTGSRRPDRCDKHGVARHRIAQDGAVVWCMQGGSVPGAPTLIRPKLLLIGLKLPLLKPIWTCTPRSTSTTVLRTFLCFEKVEDSLRLRTASTLSRSGRFLSSEMLSAAINTQTLTRRH